jgi:hypothetical protein
MAWYLTVFAVGPQIRQALGLVDDLAGLDDLLARLDHDQPFPRDVLGRPRGRQGSPRDRVALPDGWLDDTDGTTLDLAGAELGVSGG